MMTMAQNVVGYANALEAKGEINNIKFRNYVEHVSYPVSGLLGRAVTSPRTVEFVDGSYLVFNVKTNKWEVGA